MSNQKGESLKELYSASPREQSVYWTETSDKDYWTPKAEKSTRCLFQLKEIKSDNKENKIKLKGVNGFCDPHRIN